MVLQLLNGHWLYRQRGTQDWMHASVPGSLQTDLLASGKIEDPFTASNEESVQWAAEKDWEYRRYFYPSAQVLAQEKIFLVCKGLDTLADVRLNGKILGSASNMFHAWEWEIKSLLKEGENQLDILFHSPITFARQRQRLNPMLDMGMGISGGQHLRKSSSHFGWDFAPRLVCLGVWKDVQLEGRSSPRLEEIRFEQAHEDTESGRLVMLTARVQAVLDTNKDASYTVRIRVTAPDRQIWQADAPARVSQAIPIQITNPQLWWPNGLGDQALYHVDVDLVEEDRTLQATTVIDTRSFDLGLRTVTLNQEEDGSAGPGSRKFQFIVNGVPVFCKGSNWIPADSFPARVTPHQLEHLLRSAAESHQNMLRVWGGGYYESDLFYDYCDRYGILVWQDFMFACATYPLDDPVFVESICREVTENVRRLRHHACLALWCGNNEIEWLSGSFGWNRKRPELKDACERFFFQTLPQLVETEDPQRAYWPGSPSSNEAYQDPNSFQRGDAHLWEVYHYYKEPAFYLTQNPRFASEFGFQSLPSGESLAQFAQPAPRKLNSRVMRDHQRAAAGTSKLVWYLSRRFRLPRHLDAFAYVSQVYQAEAVRLAVEHWRTQPALTSGALYWQLNDCWPAISWSGIDYYGRWKALHYAARRFFAPVHLSVKEEVDKGAQKAAVWVTNDRRTPWNGRLLWTLETIAGDVLEGGEQAVTVEAVASTNVINLDFSHPKAPIRWNRTVLTIELWQGDERLSLGVINFVPEKNMALPDPGLQAEIEAGDGRLLVHLTTQKLARFIELKLEGADLIFSDNYFDLPAKRSTTVVCALPDGWSVEQARAALKVRTLADTRPNDPPLAGWLKGTFALAESMVRSGMLYLRLR